MRKLLTLEDLQEGMAVRVLSTDPREELHNQLGYLPIDFSSDSNVKEGHVYVKFDYKWDHLCGHGVEHQHLEIVKFEKAVREKLAILVLEKGFVGEEIMEVAAAFWKDSRYGSWMERLRRYVDQRFGRQPTIPAALQRIYAAREGRYEIYPGDLQRLLWVAQSSEYAPVDTPAAEIAIRIVGPDMLLIEEVGVDPCQPPKEIFLLYSF